MACKLYQLAITGLFLSAVQMVAAPSARAEVTNLVCKSDFRGETIVNYFWVDTEKKTIIHGRPQTNDTMTYTETPVDILTTAYRWTDGAFTETLDRNTGRLSTSGGGGTPMPQYDPLCEKGTMPPPAPKL